MTNQRNYTTHWYRKAPFGSGDTQVWCGATFARPDRAAFGACHVTCRACKVARRDGLLPVRLEYAARRAAAITSGAINGSPDERAAMGIPLTAADGRSKIRE